MYTIHNKNKSIVRMEMNTIFKLNTRILKSLNIYIHIE